MRLLDDATIEANVASIRTVFERLLTFGDGPTDAVMVNNHDWLGQVKEFREMYRERRDAMVDARQRADIEHGKIVDGLGDHRRDCRGVDTRGSDAARSCPRVLCLAPHASIGL